MSGNPIILQVNDGIAPSIAANLKQIETNSRSADASIQSLKQALDAIQATSLGNLSRTMSTNANSTAKLSQATTNMGIAAITASQNVDKLVGSYQNLSAALGQVTGLMTTYGNVVRTANIASVPFAQNLKKAGTNAHGSVTDVMAASAAIRGLEGNFGTSVRAGERFLVNILGMGPILRLAFPVFGALAFLGIIDILATHVNALRDAFNRLDGEITRTENDAIIAGEKILKIKPPSFFSASNFSKLMIQDLSTQGDIEINNAQTILKQLTWKRELAQAQNEVNEKSLTGVALNNQRIVNAQKEQSLIEEQKKAVDSLARNYRDMLEAKHQIQNTVVGQRGSRTVTMEVSNISDPKQIKEIQNQMQIAAQASAELGHQIDMIKPHIDALRAHEPVIALKDDIKAAKNQAIAFSLEMSKLKQSTETVTPQQKVALLKDQLDRALPRNVPQLESQIANLNQQITRQHDAVSNVIDKLREQNAEVGTYSDRLRETSEFEKIENGLKKEHIVLTEEQSVAIKDLISLNVKNAALQKELKTIYTEFNEPLRKEIAGLQAVNQLQEDGAINANQAQIAANQLVDAYVRSINPLNDYVRGLKDQVELLGQYGIVGSVAAQIQTVRNELIAKGRDLTASEANELARLLTQLEKQKIIQQQVNQLYDQYGGQLVKLGLSQQAFNEAQKKGIITDEQYAVATAKLRVEQAELQLQMQKGDTFKNLTTSVFGSYIKNFQGFTAETTKLYQNMFTSIADGAADALGRAIAFGENLGDALKNVARSALSELLSGFIKLGIQMLIAHVIGTSSASAAAAQAAITGSAVAAAWAPAAAMVSLATFGANAAPADAAIITTNALAEMLSVLHFSNGGAVPGFGNSDSVPAFLMPGEFVLRKSAVNAVGLDYLMALNSGGAAVRANGAASSGRATMHVSVEHDGSTAVAVQRVSEDRVRIIAKQVAEDTVQSNAPKAIAADLNNPNSHTSKAMKTNFAVRNKR